MRGRPAMMIGGASSIVVDLGVAGQQVGQQQPVLQELEQLGVEPHRAGGVEPVHVAQRVEQDVEALLVVTGPEVDQTRSRRRPGGAGRPSPAGRPPAMAAMAARISSISGVNLGAARSSMWMASLTGPPRVRARPRGWVTVPDHDHDRGGHDRRVTDAGTAPQPSTSCSPGSASSIARSWTGPRRWATGRRWPRATSSWPRCSGVALDAYLFADPDPARSSSTSTRRLVAIGAGAATTPTPTTPSPRSIRPAPTG